MTRFRLFLLWRAALSFATASAHAANEVESNFHATICVRERYVGCLQFVWHQ